MRNANLSSGQPTASVRTRSCRGHPLTRSRGVALTRRRRLQILWRQRTQPEPIGPQGTQLPNIFLAEDSFGPFWPHFQRRAIQSGIQRISRNLGSNAGAFHPEVRKRILRLLACSKFQAATPLLDFPDLLGQAVPSRELSEWPNTFRRHTFMLTRRRADTDEH
jgi:hypothetical protein